MSAIQGGEGPPVLVREEVNKRDWLDNRDLDPPSLSMMGAVDGALPLRTT